MSTLSHKAKSFVPRQAAAPAGTSASKDNCGPNQTKEEPNKDTSKAEQQRSPLASVQPSQPVFKSLKDPPALDRLLQGDTSRLTSVTFEADFGVRDAHVIRLVDAVGPQLTALRLGDSGTGDGVYLTDAAVLRIAERCPQLTVLQLSSCTNVSTKAFIALTERLARLQELHVTGHDRTSGALTAKALDPLLKGSALPQLARLYLTDQGKLSYELLQRLMKARRGLRVQAGDTDSDSAAWGFVMRQMGRSYGDGLYGNMGGGGGGGKKRRVR